MTKSITKNIIFRAVILGVFLANFFPVTGFTQPGIEILSLPGELSGAQYSGSPILFQDKLYMRYRLNGKYFLASYSGEEFTSYPAVDELADFSSQYMGDPIVLNDKLFLRYKRANGRHQLAAFDGTDLVFLPYTLIPGEEGKWDYLGRPVVVNEKLYLKYQYVVSNLYLLAYNGTGFEAFDVPQEFTGANRGYSAPVYVYDDKLYGLFFGKNGNQVLGYATDSSLTFIPSPSDYDAGSSGFWGEMAFWGGKLFAAYRKNDGGFGAAVLESDSLNFIDIPVDLGGQTSQLYGVVPVVLNGELLLRLQLPTDEYALVAIRDSGIKLIESPSGFDQAFAGPDAFTMPFVHQGRVYYQAYDNESNGQVLIYDGYELIQAGLSEGITDASVGEVEEFYPFANHVFTSYSEGSSNVQQLAAIDGTELLLFDEPDTSLQVTFDGTFIAFQGTLYFRYIVNNHENGFLARLNGLSTPVAQTDISHEVRLYPNPSTHRLLTLELENPATGPVQVQVFDLQGRCLRREVWEKPGALFSRQLDLSGLPAGVYTVQTLQAGGYRAIRKLVLL